MSTHRYAELYQLRFEHHRVKMLIAAHDFPEAERRRHTAEVREMSREQGFDGYLTFRALAACRQFSSCPVRLQAKSVASAYIDRLTLPYFLNLKKTFLHRMYLERWEAREEGDSRPFGLIFGLPHPRGGVILHDADLPGRTDGTTLEHTSRTRGEPPALTLEPYKLFLRRLVKHWRTGTPMPTAGPREDVRPRLDRWMVERLGSGPAVLVFAWLHGAWYDPQRRYVTIRKGVACMCVTQPLIAQQTGLGADAVKYALATLKRERLIAAARGDRRTYLTVAGVEEEITAGGQ